MSRSGSASPFPLPSRVHVLSCQLREGSDDPLAAAIEKAQSSGKTVALRSSASGQVQNEDAKPPLSKRAGLCCDVKTTDGLLSLVSDGKGSTNLDLFRGWEEIAVDRGGQP